MTPRWRRDPKWKPRRAVEAAAEHAEVETNAAPEAEAVDTTEIADEASLPSVEASALTDLSVPMAAATAELEEAERVEESVASSEAAAPIVEHSDAANAEAAAVAGGDAAEPAAAEIAPAPLDVAAQAIVEFEIAPPQEPVAAADTYELPAEEVAEEPAVVVEEVAPVEHTMPVAAAEPLAAQPEAASVLEAPAAEVAPAETPAANQDEIAEIVEPTAAKEAAHIEVPAELLAPPLVFSSAAPIAEEIHDEPVHELNPEPQGPEVAANRLELLDISQAVRTPGKFSSANPVSDASIESLLAIAEEEDSAVRRSQALKVVPDRKREPLPAAEHETLLQVLHVDGNAVPLQPEITKAASSSSNATFAASAATPETNSATAKAIKRVTPPIVAVTAARPVAPIASASALPHVALRSASQQTAHHDALLGDGDKKYRGLVIIAIFVLLAGCFAVGYSRHIGIEWPWSATSTAATGAKPATPNAQPPAASAPTTPDPSSAAPAIRNPTTITQPNKKSGTAALPDASNVQPDANFEASAPPAAQPASPSFFPVTAPSEGEAPRMMTLPEETVFDSPRVAIRLRQDFFVPAQPGPEWKHNLQRIQVGQALWKTPPPPASQSDAGVVHVRATVGADGVVKNVRPIDGPVALIPRSTDAIRKWRYQPSLLEGQPLEWQGDFSIEFRPAR